MKKALRILLVLAVGATLIAGCAKAKVAPIQKMDAPDWVKKGSGAFTKEKGKVFYGVGSASNIKNMSLLRSTADNRARNELAKVFETYSSSLMKDYMASTAAGSEQISSSEEQHVEQAIKTVTATTLTGVEIVDYWQDPGSGEFFSLARLDVEAFKENLSKMEELGGKAKEYIKQNADRLHEELEKEEAKRGVQ